MILFDDKDKIQTLEVKCEMLEQESTRLCKEIVALKLMVRDMYLWINSGSTWDCNCPRDCFRDMFESIPSDRWREIKSIVGEAADL